MEFQFLQINADQGLAVVKIHRPEKKNALSPEVLAEILDAFTDLGSREDVNVIVFTGGEDIFSAGFDLHFIRSLTVETNEDFVSLFHAAYRAVLFCPVPVIAAVGGPAIAGGFDLTLMCDIRYAAENARFGQREILLALTPLLDPLWRIVGLANAKELTFTGRIYGADEALRLGYVSRVFPKGELIENVMKIAREMAAFDRRTLVETKRLAQTVLTQDLDTSMKNQEWLFRSYIGTDENHRRIDSLLESLKKK